MRFLLFVSCCVLYCRIAQILGQCTTSGCRESSGNSDEHHTNDLAGDVEGLRKESLTLSAALERIEESLRSISQQTKANYLRQKFKVCPSSFDYLPAVDGCYKVIFQSLDWFRASEVCKRVMPGVHLAAITSAVEQNAITNYLQQEFRKRESQICFYTHYPIFGKTVWIGGQTQDPARCRTPYVWRIPDELEVPFNYSNWYEGEPSCSFNMENCAHVMSNYNYSWNDSNCTLTQCALCEF